jgi:PAS domain S-box-containing protein
LAVTLRDVTEQRHPRKLQTRKLLDTEEHLRLAAEAALIGTWEVDPEANARHWSAQFRAILGLSDSVEPDDQLFSSLIDPNDRDRINGMYRAAYAGENGGSYAAEFRIRRANDAALRWVSARGRVFFDDDGRPTRGVAVAEESCTLISEDGALSYYVVLKCAILLAPLRPRTPCR